MPKPTRALFPHPADRRQALEAIARPLRGSMLADPVDDLAVRVAGVEVIEGLHRAGFAVVRSGRASGTPP